MKTHTHTHLVSSISNYSKHNLIINLETISYFHHFAQIFSFIGVHPGKQKIENICAHVDNMCINIWTSISHQVNGIAI